MSYYTKTGNPASNTRGLSTQVRSEFAAIESGLAQAETAIGLKAPLASPVFTGTPIAPTPADGDVTAKLATTAFVKNAVDAAVINGVQGVVPMNSYQLLAPSSIGSGGPVYDNTQVIDGQTFLKTGVIDSKTTYPNAELISYCYYTATGSPYATENLHYAKSGGNGSQVLFISGTYYLHFYNGVNAEMTKSATPLTSTVYSNIVYVAGKWVWVESVANGRRAGYSTDGSTFTENATALPASMYFQGLASNGTTAVAIGLTSSSTATTTFAYTTDGVTWSPGTMPSGTWNVVVYAAGKFMAFNSSNTVNCYAYSTDGVAWTIGTFPVAAYLNSYVSSYAWPNDATTFFVFTGAATYKTTNGIDWVLAPVFNTYGISNQPLVVKIGARYFIGKQNSKYIFSTTDFITFRPEITNTAAIVYYTMYKTGADKFICGQSNYSELYKHPASEQGFVGSTSSLYSSASGTTYHNPYFGSPSTLYYYKRVA